MFLSNKLTINNPSKSLKPRSSFLNKQLDRHIRDSILSIPNLINFSRDPDNFDAIILNDVIPEEEYNKTNDEIFSEKQIKKIATGTFGTHDYKRPIVKKSTLNNKEERKETMNRSFVVFEKQQYIDKNASFIKTNNQNDTEDEEFGNRSTIIKPQEIMSKAELSTLINLYEPRKNRNSNKKMKFGYLNLTTTEIKNSDVNIRPVNPEIPKLDMYSNNFHRFATKSWIDDAFDSPREKEPKYVENFEEDNEYSNFNKPCSKHILNNITSSPHNFIQQKDKKSDISDDEEEDFIYDGRNRHFFSFYTKDNKQPNTNFIKKSIFAIDKKEIETISEHPQENILSSSHNNNCNISENGITDIIRRKINFVIDNNICDNISSQYNNADIKIITVNNFELAKGCDFNQRKIQLEENMKISQRENVAEKEKEDQNSRDVTDLPFDIKNLNLLEKKKLNQNKINLEGFLMKNPTKPENYRENNFTNYLSAAAQSDSKSRDSNKLNNYKISQTSSNSSAPSSFSSKFNSSSNIKSEINNKEQISSLKNLASYLGEKSKNLKDYLSASKQNSNSIDDPKMLSSPLTNILDEKNSRFNRNIYQTTSKLSTQDRSNDFNDLKKTIQNAFSTSLSTSKKPSQNNTDSSVGTHTNNQNMKDSGENSSYSSQYKKLITNKFIQKNSIIPINHVNPIKKTSSIPNHNQDLISSNRAESIVSRKTDKNNNNEESNKTTAYRLNTNINSNTCVSTNTITNTMSNIRMNFHDYNDLCELKNTVAKENNTHTNTSYYDKEKNKSNIFKSQLQCPQHQQYVVLQKALPYSKYNLDLLPKTKAHDEKEVLYNNIADYQTLNQLINSVKKAYNHQIMNLKKNYSGKGSVHRSTSPYHRNEKYKLERKKEKFDNINKLYSINFNKTSKNYTNDKKSNPASNNHIDNYSPDIIDENTLIELLEEIKERSNKIQNHFKEKEENMNNQINELQENLKLYQEKEKNLNEEITGWKSKLAYFIEDFRKKNKEDKSEVSKTNFMNTTTKSNELGINFEEIMKEMNEEKNKKSSKIYMSKKSLDNELICNLKYNDLPKIISDKTFSQEYNFLKLKSYHLILKEIGLDPSTFYDGVSLSDLEDDICEECFVNDCGSSAKAKSICFVSSSSSDKDERIIYYLLIFSRFLQKKQMEFQKSL